jgi:biotin operon repressor BirA-like protein
MKIPFFRQLSKTAYDVLERLSDGEFHSGLDLAEDLQVSRIAIWKVIQKLKHCKLSIETHRRWGYRLDRAFLELLSERKITEYLPLETRYEFEIFIYHHCPLAHWANRFFENRRPLTDLSICLLETQGDPPTPLWKNIHTAIGLSLFSLFEEQQQFQQLNECIQQSIDRSLKKTTEHLLLDSLQLSLQPNSHGHFLIILELKFTFQGGYFFNRNQFIALFLQSLYEDLLELKSQFKTQLKSSPKSPPKNSMENQKILIAAEST